MTSSATGSDVAELLGSSECLARTPCGRRNRIPPRGRFSLASPARDGKTWSMNIRPFQTTDEEAVIALWKTCGLVVPRNDPVRDIQRKLKVQADLFLVGCVGGDVVASVMAGYEGHRGWINYLAVNPSQQRKGLGQAMMDEAERQLRERGCPKINLQVRSTNVEVIEFYQHVGYDVDDVVSLGKRLENDDDEGEGHEEGDSRRPRRDAD